MAQSELTDTVSVLEQWVETEKDIAETRSQWEAEKASMESLIEVYSQEIKVLDETIESAREDVSAVDLRKNELTEKETNVKQYEAKLEENLADAEQSVLALAKVLPPPLLKELTPLLNTIPKDSKETKLSLGQRIQPIVAVLTQVQKFNQAVTVIEDFREFEAGRTVQVESIYLGLGIAYYLDQANEHAGYGTPGADGWTWVEDETIAQKVRGFLDIYHGKRQAEYVDLPVKLN